MELQDILESFLAIVDEYKFAVMGAILAIAVGFGAVYWYRAQRLAGERSANDALIACMKLVQARVGVEGSKLDEQAVVYSSKDEKWTQVAETASRAYHQHRSSGIAGVFAALCAQAHSELGQFDEARVTMRDATQHTPAGALQEWYQFYTALRELDSEQSEQQGLAALKALASNPESVMAGAALSELGEYYWSRGEEHEARSYWNTLAVTERDKESYSPWYERVRSRLKLMQA